MWASIYVFGAIVYTIFARGETQDWALNTGDRCRKQSKSYVGKKSGKFSLGHIEVEEDNKL